MEATESRYAHLLKPIRELTQNWEIDVASELNDYLEELEEMSITIDGGQITLNFAEAALLIQGSACIYSKKVELLHSLVYQTLEYINDRNKKRTKQAATSAEDGEDQAESNQDKEEDSAFKSLDCVTSNKDCPEDADSNTNVYVPPLPPEALIPFEPREKQKAPLISLKGEDLGSWRDFRINNYIPDAENFIDIRFKLDTVWSKAIGENWRNDQWSLSQHQGPGGPVEAPWNVVMGAANDDAGAGDNGGGSFLHLEDNGMEMDVEGEVSREHIERNQAAGEGRVLRERHVQPSEEEQKRKEEEVAARKHADIWKLLDPYEEIGENKPLKPGKCYSVPAGLDGGKRKRKGDAQLEDFRIFLSGMCGPPEQKLRNGPTFTDLNYIYVGKIKEKLNTRKRNLRRAGVVVSDQVLEEEFAKTYLQPEVAAQGENEEALHLPDLPGGDDDQNSDGEHEALPDFDIPLPGSQTEGASYEDLVQKHVERFLKNTQGYAQVTELSRRVEEWEEKIRPVLEMQETRAVFDIHKYGDKIVESLGSVKHRKSFASIVCGLDNFEACKYMLASLQLANDNTVEIDQAEGLEESLDTMALTLLCKDRATDRFKNLQSSQ